MNQLKQALISQLQLLPPKSTIEPKLEPKVAVWGNHIYQAHVWLNWQNQRLLLLLELKYNPFTKSWYLSWQKPDFGLTSLKVLDLAACRLLYQLLKQPVIELTVPETAITELWPHLAALATNNKKWPVIASAAHPAKEFLAALTAFQAQTADLCSFEKLKLPLELIFDWLVYCDDFIKVDLATSDPKSTYTLAMLLDVDNQLLLNLEQIDKPDKCSLLLKQEKIALSGDLFLLCQQLLQMSESALLEANVIIV